MLRRQLLSVFVCCVCFAAVGIAAFLVDRTEMVKWVGAADLIVEFAITDSGRPIPNARIHVHCEGGWYDEVEADCKAPFELRCNDEGIATRLLRNSRTIGSVSRLRFTNTYCIYSPIWNIQASANGYETSEWIHLWDDYPGKGTARGGSKSVGSPHIAS
jgi:hypothetical protein